MPYQSHGTTVGPADGGSLAVASTPAAAASPAGAGSPCWCGDSTCTKVHNVGQPAKPMEVRACRSVSRVVFKCSHCGLIADFALRQLRRPCLHCGQPSRDGSQCVYCGREMCGECSIFNHEVRWARRIGQEGEERW